MKKYIIVVAIFTLIFAASKIEMKYLTKTFKEFDTQVQIVAEKAMDKSASKADAEGLIAWWEGKKLRLDLIVPHINITEADMRLGEMQALIEGKKYEEAYAQLMILKSLSKRIIELLSR